MSLLFMTDVCSGCFLLQFSTVYLKLSWQDIVEINNSWVLFLKLVCKLVYNQGWVWLTSRYRLTRSPWCLGGLHMVLVCACYPSSVTLLHKWNECMVPDWFHSLFAECTCRRWSSGFSFKLLMNQTSAEDVMCFAYFKAYIIGCN